MRGGWQRLTPMGAPMNDNSMEGPTMMSNSQGEEYQAMHEGQHGGASLGEGAPVGSTGILDPSLRLYARVSPIDEAIAQTAGMSDQAGGRRRSMSKKHGGRRRSMSKKHGGRRGSMSKKHGGRRRSMSKKHGGRRRSMRRKQGGGATLMPASADAPGMILPASAGAEAGMNPEWRLAANPSSFIPDGVRH